MNSLNRRSFLGAAAAAAGAGALPVEAQSPAAKGSFHLGSVTYNLLKDWDVETIIKTLEAVGFEAVELRTEHLHLSPVQDLLGVAPVKGLECRGRKIQPVITPPHPPRHVLVGRLK